MTGAKVIRIDKNAICNDLKFKLQFNKGDADYIYEPYTGKIASPNPDYPQDIEVVTGENTITISNEDNTESQTFNINLGHIELCKIGDYQDYFYKSNNKWYVEKQIGKVTLNGGENWALGSASSNNYYVFQKNGVLNNANEPTIYCDNFTNIGYQSSSIVNDFECVSLNASSLVNSYLRIWIKSSRLSEKTASAFKTWLSTHNTEIQYVLETPTTTEITDTELINQLEALKKAISYDGQTNISQTNNDLPFILNVSALKKNSSN